MRVPFADLTRQYQEIRPEVDEAIRQVFERGSFTNDAAVRDFEKDFARLHAPGECIAVGNGTAALHTALLAAGIGPGDEVLLPSHTFISTALAVSHAGATPVFVDCDPEYYLIDAENAAQKITVRTRAIIAVHLYGQMAAMEKIQDLADTHNLLIIEDCAQAHLATRKDRVAGTWGIAGCFSFYPVKNLGAYGEGGAVISASKDLITRVKMLRTYGSSDKYTYEFPGFNYRMSELQGAILRVKLRHLQNWNSRRAKMADYYNEQLKEVSQIALPKVMEGNNHVYHLYVIRTERRDALREYLTRAGITTEIHYPRPCHLQPVYAHSDYRPGALPVTEMITGQILSLPLNEQLTPAQADYVCETIRSFFTS